MSEKRSHAQSLSSMRIVAGVDTIDFLRYSVTNLSTIVHVGNLSLKCYNKSASKCVQSISTVDYPLVHDDFVNLLVRTANSNEVLSHFSFQAINSSARMTWLPRIEKALSRRKNRPSWIRSSTLSNMIRLLKARVWENQR